MLMEKEFDIHLMQDMTIKKELIVSSINMNLIIKINQMIKNQIIHF